MNKRLTIFVEGETDKLFFSYLLNFFFRNAKRKKWDKNRLNIISLDGICNAYGIVKNTIIDLDNKERYIDTVCLIYDTDAFEYEKKPPIGLQRVKRITEENNCDFFSIGIVHNVEDMISFSKDEIIKYLKIPSTYKIPKNLYGINLLKALHKEVGLYYIKGSRCEDLIKCLNYSAIGRKYCSSLRILCDYLELNCSYNLCKIKK